MGARVNNGVLPVILAIFGVFSNSCVLRVHKKQHVYCEDMLFRICGLMVLQGLDLYYGLVDTYVLDTIYVGLVF